MSTDWKKAKLGDVVKIKHGYALKGEFFSSSGFYILLTPGNFCDEGGFKHKGEKEKYYIGEVPKGYILEKGDLIIAMTEQKHGLLGSSAIVPKSGKYLHNQRLGLIIDLDETAVNKKFLYYLFNSASVRAQIQATANGIKVRHTSPSRIYEVDVILPNLYIQQKIASILSTYDDLIENNTRRIQILEVMAQRIYHEWFVHFRYPGYEKDKLVESELGMIPKGWEMVRVENLVRRVSPGKLYSQKTTSPKGSVPILDQGRSGIIGCHNEEPGIVASFNNPIIVFANHTCYQRLILHPFSAIQNVIPFLPCVENFRNIYWLHWATKDIIEFNDYKGHWPEFMTKKLFLPAPELCNEFGRIIKPKVYMILRLQQKNEKLRQIRELLLPKLISGKIDVSDLDIDIGETDGSLQ